MGNQERIFSFGGFRWVPSRHQLLEGDRPMRVGSRALGLLELLVENAGEVVTKQRLMAAVWNGTWVDEANLRANIAALRKVLGDGRDGRRYIVNVPRRGYRFVEPIVSEPVAAQPNGKSRSPEWTLPVTPRLIGRSETVKEVTAQLATHRLVTVTGSGGIGKTSLALAVAEKWAESHSELKVLIDLTTVKDAAHLWTAASRAIGGGSGPNPQSQVVRSIRSQACLVVLDNCEHIVGAAAEFSATVLKSDAGVRVLATGREPLRVQEEWVHRLASLDSPDRDASLTAQGAVRYSAVELLVERIAAVVGGYELNDHDAPFAAEICRSLDGNPLALELAAAQAEAFSMQQLAEGLRDRFAFLSKGRRGAPPRHQSLYAMLDWSCQLLTSDERAMVGRLSVFPTWFEMADAIQLGIHFGMPAAVVSGCVSNLVTKSIVAASFTAEGARYRLQETVRAFGRTKLDGAGETDDAFRALTAHVTQALTLDEGSDEGARSRWLARCSHHMANVRACLERAIGDGLDLTAGVDLISKALPFWMETSHLVEHRVYLEPALAHLLTQRPRRRGDELAIETAIGLSHYFSGGPTPQVVDRLKHALALARTLGLKAHELNILWMLYGIAGNWGDYRAQMRFAMQFGTASLPVRDVRTKVRRHRMLARAYHDVGDQRTAVKEIEMAVTAPLPPAPAHIDAYSIEDGTAALAIRSRILWVTGAIDDARAAAEECLARGLAIDHAQSICWAITFNLCPVAIWSGDTENARHLTSLAMAHSEKTFDHWNEWAQTYRVLLGQADTHAASELLGRMIPAQRDLFAALSPAFAGDDIRQRALRPPCWCSPELARLAVEVTPTEKARETDIRLLRKADLLASNQGALSWRLRIATTLARLYLAQNEGSEARAALEPVYERFKQGFQTRDLQAAATLLAEM
jgi:predicted ATPase/DNA-binding winged helix-turn-helix (wHTH) protein